MKKKKPSDQIPKGRAAWMKKGMLPRAKKPKGKY